VPFTSSYMASNSASWDFPTAAMNTAVFRLIDNNYVFIIRIPKGPGGIVWAINHQHWSSVRPVMEIRKKKVEKQGKEEMDCGFKRYSSVTFHANAERYIPRHRLLPDCAHILMILKPVQSLVTIGSRTRLCLFNMKHHSEVRIELCDYEFWSYTALPLHERNSYTVW